MPACSQQSDKTKLSVEASEQERGIYLGDAKHPQCGTASALRRVLDIYLLKDYNARYEYVPSIFGDVAPMESFLGSMRGKGGRAQLSAPPSASIGKQGERQFCKHPNSWTKEQHNLQRVPKTS